MLFRGYVFWPRDAEFVSGLVHVTADVKLDSVLVHEVVGIDLRKTSTAEFVRLCSELRRETGVPRAGAAS